MNARKLSIRPKVAVNFAMTWDGKISTRNYTPSDFSSKGDKRRLLEIRATADALLVGKSTVELDNMSMGLPAEDLRAARVRRQQAVFPLRVVLSNSGRIKPSLKIFQHDFSPVLIYSTTRMPKRTQSQLSKAATLHLTDAKTVDLRAMLHHLRAHYNVKRLVCEGGPTLLRALLAIGVVDEINLTFCPRIFGGKDAPTLTGPPGDFLPRTVVCELAKMEALGGECFLSYRIGGGRRGRSMKMGR